MNDFKIYLLKNTHINSKNVPYYQKWVLDCYVFLNKDSSSSLDINDKKRFLQSLSKKHEPWQIKQASYALQLYSFYLSQKEKKCLIDSNMIYKTQEQLEEETRKMLRLQHKSYNTEKTYTYWLRYFCSFIKHKLSQEYDGKDLQDFLTYLAVEKGVGAFLFIMNLVAPTR